MKVTRERLPLITVVGASGSGKSSVIRAGLLPRLRLEQALVWDAAIFTPGDAPFRNLAEALALVENKDLDSWQRRVKANERGAYLASRKLTITDAVDITLNATAGIDQLLLVVDQFEELFTLTSEEERRPFVDSLIAATRTAPVTVLLTLRAEFYRQSIALTRELSDLLPQGLINVGPLRREEWKTIIEEPASLVGLQLESGLADRILKDVEAQPDSLPLLEYALTELWKRRQGCVMTHAQYTDLGGIEGAVSKRADAVLARLPLAQQDRALRTLTRLIWVSIEEDEGVDTRLRVRLADFDEASHQLLQPFVEERLLVTNRNPITGEETIEVAHEALIRRWGKLREVLDKDREFLYWRRRLNFRMQEWETAHHDHGALLHGALRTEAQQWLAARPADLTEREREFITWDERDEYQIAQILSQGLSLMRYAPENHYIIRLITLAVCIDRDRTLDAALGIDNARARAWVLQEVAVALARAGHAEQAREAGRAAIGEARAIRDAGQRTQALQEVAVALADAGHAEQAREATRAIRDAGPRAQALQGVAVALARVGYVEQALEAARALADAGHTEQAREAAHAIRDVGQRAQALQEVAAAPTESGHAEQARGVARAIRDAGQRAWALQEVAVALARAGHAEQAREAGGAAHEAARAIRDAGQRAQALQGVAAALTESGHAEQAREVWEAALEAVRAIQDIGQRARVLEEIAAALARAGRAEQAWPVVNEALNAIHSIDEDELRSNVCAHLAGALASLRRYRLAREMADLCSQTAHKVRAYTTILQAYVLDRNPDLAYLFEGRPEEFRFGSFIKSQVSFPGPII